MRRAVCISAAHQRVMCLLGTAARPYEALVPRLTTHRRSIGALLIKRTPSTSRKTTGHRPPVPCRARLSHLVDTR